MAKSWFFVLREPDSPAEILIYDVIGGYGVRADVLVAQIQELSDQKLIVRINSPGGDYYDALAIANALARHGNAEAHVDGMAASAATIIALGAQRVVMSRGAVWMIHNPWASLQGDADELRKAAQTLDGIEARIIEIYRAKTGLDEDVIREYMAQERYFLAEEALQLGFVDALEDADIATAACAPVRYRAMLAKDKVEPSGIMSASTPDALCEGLRRLGAHAQADIVLTLHRKIEEMTKQIALLEMAAGVSADCVTSQQHQDSSPSWEVLFSITDPSERSRYYRTHKNSLTLTR